MTERTGAQEACEQFLALPLASHLNWRMLQSTMEFKLTVSFNTQFKEGDIHTICGFSCYDHEAHEERNDNAAMIITSIKK